MKNGTKGDRLLFLSEGVKSLLDSCLGFTTVPTLNSALVLTHREIWTGKGDMDRKRGQATFLGFFEADHGVSGSKRVRAVWRSSTANLASRRALGG